MTGLTSRVGQVWLYRDRDGESLFIVVGSPFIADGMVCHPVLDLLEGEPDSWYEYRLLQKWEQNSAYSRVA